MAGRRAARCFTLSAMASTPTTIVWFRRDLRVADHPALTWAASRGDVVCLWILDPDLLSRRHHQSVHRRRFLRAGLDALDEALRGLGVPLVVRRGPPHRVLEEVVEEVAADAVTWSDEHSPYGRRRDDRVREVLAGADVHVEVKSSGLLVEPEDLPGSSGNGYRVFTPFSKVWVETPVPAHEPAPRRLSGPEIPGEDLDPLGDGEPLLDAGPDAARAAIVEFIRGGSADAYDEARDALAEDATSRLGPYLRFGMCTTAQVGRALGLPGDLSPGRRAFWRQLCWREFYHHHLARNPEVARRAFQPQLADVEWDNDPDMVAAWTEGRTGYPVIDAGMRQLRQSGWMHNRARMICASFLVKDLLVDWRIGERVFMQHLLDGDPANNNGGWQWTAGTGTDAAPYFRVFNPTRQAQRFDPEGGYVRRWVPELAGVPDRYIHEPWKMNDDQQQEAGCVVGTDYPAPIVDHLEQRGVALERYRAAADAHTG